MASLEVDNLTDSELRSKLAECGHPVGPVTETTRKILIKKLKILMKQKSTVKNSNRSLTRFSSGDDSGSDTDQNGSSRNSRRISMPPPTSYKSSKRRTSTRNSTPDVSPVPSISKITSSTPVGPTRSNAEIKSRFSTPSSIKQSYFPPKSRSTIGSPPSFTYEFDSGSDSDVTNFNRSPGSSRRKCGPTYGTLSSYRSRLNNSSSSSISKTSTDLNLSRLKNYSGKKEPRQNILSGFVGRLSQMSDSLNPQDIKESDAEDDSPSEKWIGMNVAARNSNIREWNVPFKSTYLNLKSKDTPVTTWWKSWNNSHLLSMALLAIFILFFIWLALAYFKITQRAALTGKSNNFYPLCTDDDDDSLIRIKCIKKEELPYAVQLYKDVHLELQARALRSVCGPVLEDGSLQKPFMTERELIQFLSRSTNTPDIWKIEQGIENLKLLLLANRHWGITLVKDSEDYQPSADCYIPDTRLAVPSDFSSGANILFISPCPRIPWTCYLIRLFYKVLFIVAMLALGTSGVYLAIISIRYYKKSKKEEEEQVMAMVERILEYVSETSDKANNSVDANGSASVISQDYVAVRHVHDTLIHPTERQRMANIWSKAVKFIEENESRIRTEVQQVWGEDATVWRWLGPPLNKTHATSAEGSNESNHLYPDLSSLKAEARRGSDRVWQGEAFETSEGSMNSLPFSPTQCLKIRHMFKPDKDYGPDWVVKVHDAIVEKCEGAKIVHLSVDQQSKEGCVYVKCASQQDAGLAYRHLHGSWFDGALVTVKYLRLERYHERFPDSVNAKLPLRPSNNLKLSLQGTSSA